jgi:hypothetical protein
MPSKILIHFFSNAFLSSEGIEREKKSVGTDPKDPPVRTRARLVPRVHQSKSTLATTDAHKALRSKEGIHGRTAC